VKTIETFGMKPRHPATLPALMALLTTLGPRALPAAERECAAIAIEPDASFRDRFPDLVEHIQSELAARPDLDACARVELHLQDRVVIRVSVTLPDGRAASRSVARSDDVMPTLEALLLVPEQTPSAAAAPTPPAPAPARHALRAVQAERTDRDLPSPPTKATRQLGFELSAISGVRIGDSQFGYGAGVLSFLEVHRWLVGFEGRADGYRSVYGSDPETALELAILAGRRVDFGSVALDFTAGPGMAMKGVTLSQSETVPVGSMPASMPHPEPTSGPVPRLLLGARLGFSPRSVFRTFVGVDGELGPRHTPVAPATNIGSPQMPRFTIGLALGATVGTP